MSASLVYITCGDLDESRRNASALVGERLAACVNRFEGLQSCYRWQGEIHEDREILLIAKTKSELVDALTARVRELHSYDVPCVVSFEIARGNRDFLKWISDETQ